MSFRLIPWLTGLILLAVTLFGANRYLHTEETPAPTDPKALIDRSAEGLIVLGTVDCKPNPVHVGPPAVAAMSRLDVILVKEGDPVTPGTPLAKFDDLILQAKLKQAQAGLATAMIAKRKAEVQVHAHQLNIERQNAKIDATKKALADLENSYRILELNARERLDIRSGANIPEGTAPLNTQKLLENDPELLKMRIEIHQLEATLVDNGKELKLLELQPIQLDIDEAQAAIERMQATIDEAQAAIEASTVKAEVAGVIEQVLASPGMTFGPSTQTPLMTIVPGPDRVVRAEIESEFAYKIDGAVGESVMIYDQNNPAIHYPGTVVRVGTAFLPKRSEVGRLTMNPSNALECLIDVTDPNPANMPPLRVGQPVRVRFGK